MARWTGHPTIGSVLESADIWRNHCFLADGSAFTEHHLWNLSGLEELLTRYRESPISGSQDFLGKLHDQLKGTTPAVIQLAAEVLWFLHLFPSKNVLSAATKREQIESVWIWSGAPAPNTPLLDDDHLDGVGHPGTAYMTHRPLEFDYLLSVVVAFKRLAEPERRRLMNEDVPWTFMDWLDAQPGSDRRLVRGALLYFLFPDHLERNVSRDHKQQIYTALKDKLPANQVIKSRTPSLGDLDRAIASIRSVLEQERGTTEVDFYDDQTKGLWFTQLRDSSVKEFTSWINSFFEDRGLQINQPGRDLRSLDEKRAVDPEVGFWKNVSFVTSKPPRWLIQFDLTGDTLTAIIPPHHRSEAIGYANTKGGDSGALAVRILPVMKLGDGEFREVERWEWLMLLCFPTGLKPGSAAEAFERFDVATGRLTYMKEDQSYIFAALLSLSAPDDQVTFGVEGQMRQVSYRQATEALQNLIRVEFPEVADE